MKKIIKDFFVDKFNCDDDALVEELFSQLDPIMTDNYSEGHREGFTRGYKRGEQQLSDVRASQSQYDYNRGFSMGKMDSFDEAWEKGFDAGKLTGIYEEKSNNLKKDKNEQTENRTGYRRYTPRFLERIFKAIR